MGLERGLGPHEHAAALKEPILQQLGAAATSKSGFILSSAAALFPVALTDCLLHLWPQDGQDQSPGRVCVVLQHLKGERRTQVLDPACRRLPAAPPGSDFKPIATPRPLIVLCPLAVFRLLAAGGLRLAQCGCKPQILRPLDHLCNNCTRLVQGHPDRGRYLYSMHPTQVAGMCHLPFAMA